MTSSDYNLLFTLYILYSSLYQKLVELELTVLLRLSEHRRLRKTLLSKCVLMRIAALSSDLLLLSIYDDGASPFGSMYDAMQSGGGRGGGGGSDFSAEDIGSSKGVVDVDVEVMDD